MEIMSQPFNFKVEEKLSTCTVCSVIHLKIKESPWPKIEKVNIYNSLGNKEKSV
jgi:hypothetical protein